MHGNLIGQDDAVMQTLAVVIDPEVGINIVDLGLVYLATRRADRILVDLTLTSRACPLGESVVAEARECLEQAFPEAVVDINLVWEPPWHPDFITEGGRAELGHSARGLF